MIRTDRSGCLLTTVAAKSCTDTDAEIRLTNDARIPMNSTSDPLDSSSSLSAGDGGHNSFQSTPSVLGSAVNTTPTPSTIATSSSCEMPASAAASNNSLLMENEIVNDRSDPRLDSDSDIEDPTPRSSVRRVCKRSVVDACRESIGWQIDARRTLLVCRRLLVTARKARHPVGLRKGSGRTRVTSYTCEAGIFGTTFANLSHVCRSDVQGRARALSSRRFRAAMYDALMPIAKNLKHMSGTDVEHLRRGLGSHRVLRLQFPKLIEAQLAPAVQRREGHPGCAFGATAAILVLFHVLALDTKEDKRKKNDADDADDLDNLDDPGDPAGAGAVALELGGALDAGGLGTQLEKMLRSAASALADWPLAEAADAAALCAEQRALQRAYVGVRLARMCDVQTEGVAGQFARRLSFFAQCAWPVRGPPLGRATHHAMLDAIASGEIASDEWVREDNCFLAPMMDDDTVVPLSALHAGEPLRRPGPDDYRSDDDSDGEAEGSSATWTTSPSTLASTAPSSAGDDAVPADPSHLAAQQTREALRLAQLAIAAAAAVLPDARPGPSPGPGPGPSPCPTPSPPPPVNNTSF